MTFHACSADLAKRVKRQAAGGFDAFTQRGNGFCWSSQQVRKEMQRERDIAYSVEKGDL